MCLAILDRFEVKLRSKSVPSSPRPLPLDLLTGRRRTAGSDVAGREVASEDPRSSNVVQNKSRLAAPSTPTTAADEPLAGDLWGEASTFDGLDDDCEVPGLDEDLLSVLHTAPSEA